MPSALPAVISALVTLAEANSDAVVSLGRPQFNGSEKAYLGICLDDPTVTEGESRGASAQHEWAYAGNRVVNEDGEITCAAIAWNGDSDQSTAMTSVFATFSALEDAVKDDPTLGLAIVRSAKFGDSISLDFDQDADGAYAQVIFTVTYLAQI